MEWGINMSSNNKRRLNLILIMTIMFSFVFPHHILIAVENEADETSPEIVDDGLENEEELEIDDFIIDEGLEIEEDPEFDDSIIDEGLEVEEVELAEREDITDDTVNAHLDEMEMMAENEHLE